MTETTDLSTQTPREIDTALAGLYNQMYALEDKIARNLGFIDNLEEGMAKEEAGDGRYTGWSRTGHERCAQMQDEIATWQDERLGLLGQTAPYQAEFKARRWSRFFLVQNNGGHIHSSMDCSTCNKRGQATRFGWLPELSGKTEPEAVAEHGAILCTVCYPSAPVEWTDRRDPSACEGSGRYYSNDLPKRTGYYSGNWAECPVCHTNQTISKPGKIRKHKKASN